MCRAAYTTPYFVFTAPPERFELPTPWFVARCSDPLSYGGNSKTSHPLLAQVGRFTLHVRRTIALHAESPREPCTDISSLLIMMAFEPLLLDAAMTAERERARAGSDASDLSLTVSSIAHSRSHRVHSVRRFQIAESKSIPEKQKSRLDVWPIRYGRYR